MPPKKGHTPGKKAAAAAAEPAGIKQSTSLTVTAARAAVTVRLVCWNFYFRVILYRYFKPMKRGI